MNIITWQFVGVHKAHDAEVGLLDLRSHRSNIQISVAYNIIEGLR
jgi:hypothetical protein